MSNFDDDIRKAVAAEGEGLVSAGDEGLFGQMAATFKGRMRLWVAFMWIMTFVMFGLAVLAAVMFFRAESVRDWIMYAAIFSWAALAVAMLKMWYWMEMNRNTHTREIKRVEIQLARLAELLDNR